MAKITAHGDSELTRWTGDNGAVVILTHKGRLLHKLSKLSGSYNLVGRNVTMEQAEEYASRRGLVRKRG